MITPGKEIQINTVPGKLRYKIFVLITNAPFTEFLLTEYREKNMAK